MTVTASIGGQSGFPNQPDFSTWAISYDDATRDVTAVGTGSKFFVVTMQITATIQHTVSFVPSAGAVSQNPTVQAALQAVQPGTVTEVVNDGRPHVVASGVNANQVSRLVSKYAPAGLPYTCVESYT